MDIDGGIVFLGLDLADWLVGFVSSLIGLVIAYRVGRLRERNAEKQIEMTDHERRTKEQQAKVDTIDRDIKARTDDFEKFEQRVLNQEERIIELEDNIRDCRSEQSKASARMGRSNRLLEDAKRDLQERVAERDEMKELLRKTKAARRFARNDLRTILEENT